MSFLSASIKLLIGHLYLKVSRPLANKPHKDTIDKSIKSFISKSVGISVSKTKLQKKKKIETRYRRRSGCISSFEVVLKVGVGMHLH